jgi:hypothetical protein
VKNQNNTTTISHDIGNTAIPKGNISKTTAHTGTEGNIFEPAPKNTDVSDEARESRAAYQKWQDEQDREANRRIAAFTRNESVFEAGQPSIPKYGQPLEGAVSGSSLDLKVYNYAKTPVEFERLEREKRYYQNIVLERQETCQICQVRLMGFDKEGKASHLDEHVKCYQRNQVCPFCENEDWGYLQAADKVKHARTHIRGFDTGDAQIICPWCNTFLEKHTDEEKREHYSKHVRKRSATVELRKVICPWCNTDLTTLDKDAQQKHCASHLNVECAWPTCHSNLTGKSEKSQYAHYKMHITQLFEPSAQDHAPPCALCHQTFDQHDEELIIKHFQSHCRRQCAWPSCNHIFSNADGEDATKAHISMHTSAKIAPDGAPEGEENGERDLDYVPEWLRHEHPGKQFYCPEKTCAQDVSGKSERPCKVSPKSKAFMRMMN